MSFLLLLLVIAFVLHVFAFGFDCLLLVFVAVVASVLHVFAFEFAWCLRSVCLLLVLICILFLCFHGSTPSFTVDVAWCILALLLLLDLLLFKFS